MFRDASLRRWTPSAKDCYFRGCVCSGCPIFEIIGNQCKMKRTVLNLVRKLGKPERRNLSLVIEEESEE